MVMIVPSGTIAAQGSEPIFLYTGQGAEKSGQWIDDPERATAYVFREKVPARESGGRTLRGESRSGRIKAVAHTILDKTSLTLGVPPGSAQEVIRTSSTYPRKLDGRTVRYLLLIGTFDGIYSTRAARESGRNLPRFYTLDPGVSSMRVAQVDRSLVEEVRQVLKRVHFRAKEAESIGKGTDATTQNSEHRDETEARNPERSEAQSEKTETSSGEPFDPYIASSTWARLFQNVFLFGGGVVLTLLLTVKLVGMYLNRDSVRQRE